MQVMIVWEKGTDSTQITLNIVIVVDPLRLFLNRTLSSFCGLRELMWH